MRSRLAPGAPAALIAGVAHAASFAPLQAWWLQTAAMAVLVALLLRIRAPGETGARGAAALGVAFGLGWFVTGVSWLYVSMHRYGGMPAPLAALAVLLFSVYLALFTSAVAALTRRVAAAALAEGSAPAPLAIGGAAFVYAGSWGLAELARGYLFTGFPWLAIGYAHVDGPLAALAPMVGSYGVSALAAMCAFGVGCTAAMLLRRAGSRPFVDARVQRGQGRPGRALAAATVVAIVPVALGWAARDLEWAQPAGRALSVRLLQGNVPQEMKFDPGRSLAAMQAYVAEASRAEADLTVLPETAWTVPWSSTPAPLRAALLAHLARNHGVIAIGMPLQQRGSPQPATQVRLTNSVAVIDRHGEVVSRYDKRHLVPFGEFIPRGFGWFVAMMDIPLGEFGRGAPDQPPLAIAGQRVAFDICYEDLFGEELAAQVRGGATILVNVSNIAWFGDSHALAQHLQIARMRAIELARPMLRATNTGVTAAIDARGRVLDALPTYSSGALALTLQGTDGLTPYARWGNLLPAALCLSLALAGASCSLAARRSAWSDTLE